MADQDKSGNMKPEELADPSKHQQFQVFEEENRTPPLRPGTSGAAGDETKAGKIEEGIVGHVAATDPTGVVVPPAEGNRPGSSTELGGTPSALTTSGGRQINSR
jgi:hypothetical protein